MSIISNNLMSQKAELLSVESSGGLLLDLVLKQEVPGSKRSVTFALCCCYDANFLCVGFMEASGFFFQDSSAAVQVEWGSCSLSCDPRGS